MVSGAELVRVGQSSASSKLMPTLGHSAERDSCTGGGATLSEWSSRASTPCGSGPAETYPFSKRCHRALQVLTTVGTKTYYTYGICLCKKVHALPCMTSIACVSEHNISCGSAKAKADLGWLQQHPQHLQHVANGFQI